MATARINIPGGISVEIEGAPDEITAVLENVRYRQSVSQVSASSVTPREGIPSLIATLKSEEFFQTPQGLSDIRKKFAEMGHHYPLTTLSGAMQAHSQKRKLRRFKRDGKWVYVQ
jgi:hypothetical protein